MFFISVLNNLGYITHSILHRPKLLHIILINLMLCSCASLWEGATTALYKSINMESNDRICQINGPSFNGILVNGDNQIDSIAKILVVHGIGGPGPGHSKRLVKGIIDKLQLNKVFGSPKIISIASEKFKNESLGQLTVSRFGTQKKMPSLIVYELTWSDITDQARDALSFDNEKYGYMRAQLNKNLKEFVNLHLTDPMIFLGGGRNKIVESVQQAFCWMINDDWASIVDGTRNYCKASLTAPASETIINDRFILISHSLGSSIMLDAIEKLANSFDNEAIFKTKEHPFDDSPTNIEILKEKAVTFFMLANQLALLNLASPNKNKGDFYSEYCERKGSKNKQRFLGNLNIVAFSDPNDLLTYTIEPDFVDKYINASICPKVTNVLVNVTEPIDFRITELANPQTAHTGYSADERIIDLIVNGTDAKSIKRDGIFSKTKQNGLKLCNWLEDVSKE